MTMRKTSKHEEDNEIIEDIDPASEYEVGENG